MPTTPTFSTQLLGQTEKTLNVFLERELAGSGLGETEWITLVLALAGGGSADRAELAHRVADGTRIPEAKAEASIARLEQLGLVESAEGASVVTDAGRELHARIRVAVTSITERLWGDLPAADLDAAGRVLSTVLARATEELAAS